MLKQLFLLTALLPSLVQGMEWLSCDRVISEDKAHPILDKHSQVSLSIEGERITSSVKVPPADKVLTFKNCSRIPADGSNFSKWFEYVCPDMQSVDGSGFAVDAYFAGAYAAISRKLTPDDAMWNPLQDASQKLGISMPQRTFVIYADRSPVFEFFCHTVRPATDKPITRETMTLL